MTSKDKISKVGMLIYMIRTMNLNYNITIKLHYNKLSIPLKPTVEETCKIMGLELSMGTLSVQIFSEMRVYFSNI